MKKVFIAYGTGRFKESLERIGKEARRLKIFSKVILYTERDLPGYVLNSPLRAFPKGDGYWIWKPYIIWKTMQDYPKAIVVYADCGSTLGANLEEWNTWFELLETYDTLAFQYRMDYAYPWVRNKGWRTTNIEWSKKSVIDYFNPLFDNRDWTKSNQVLAGLVLACRNSHLIRSWLEMMLLHPELIMDCHGNELENQESCFRDHRHDQSIFSVLVAYWSSKGNVVKVLPETAESCEDAAVRATRKKALDCPPKPSVPLKTRLIIAAKRLVGDSMYERIHSVLDKSSLFRRLTFSMER